MKKLMYLLTILAAASLCQQASAQKDSLALPEVVVTGARQAVDIRHLPMTVTVIDRQKLTAQHQYSVLPTAMQQVPGLFVTSRSMLGYGVSTGASGEINLRGISGSSGQMMVLIDGHPQYQGVYGHPISDSYQTMMAERIEVLRGPASVLYGSNAMGGVINIVTRQVPRDTVATHVSLAAGSWGTLQAEATNQLRSGKFSSTVALQYGRTDNHRPNMGFEQYGGYVKVGYDFNSHWDAYADLNLTHFNASNPGTVMQPKWENDQYITRGVASLVVSNHYDRTSGAISVFDNFGRHKINDGYYPDSGKPQTDLFRSKDAVAGVSAYQTVQLFQGNHTTVGFDYQHIYGRAYYTNRQTGETVTTQQRLKQSAHAHENEVAGYADFRQDVTSWLTVDGGLRFDHHSTAGNEWVPQFGMVVRPMPSAEVKLTASKGFRNPTNKEMYLYGTANHDSLRAERLWNYEVAWSHRIGTFSYGLNAYYIKGDNMIQTVAGKNVNTGAIENYGAEFQASYRIGNGLTLSTNHSLLHMKNKVVAAPTYKGALDANYQAGKWHVQAGAQYISGLYTEVGASETKEQFCLVHASVGYDLSRSLSLWARGENLLAQKYEINKGYPMPRATVMAGVDVSF